MNIAIRTVLVVGVVSALGACSTPPEIKQASAHQLKLIAELNAAILDFERGLVAFHVNKEALARQEGRILIAQQAIDVAVDDLGARRSEAINADELFERHERKIRPWVISTLSEGAVEAEGQRLRDAIDKLEQRIAVSTDDRQVILLQEEVASLEDRLTELNSKPEALATLEETILDGIQNERDAAEAARSALRVVREQVAVMLTLARTIDAWLSTDLRPSDEQIGELQQAASEAAGRLSGGGS